MIRETPTRNKIHSYRILNSIETGKLNSLWETDLKICLKWFIKIYYFFLSFLYYKKVSLQRNISVRGTFDHGKSRKKFENFLWELFCICCVKSFHTQNLLFWNIFNEFLNVYEKRKRKFWIISRELCDKPFFLSFFEKFR